MSVLRKYCDICEKEDKDFVDQSALLCIECGLSCHKDELIKGFKNYYAIHENARTAIGALRNLFIGKLNWNCKEARQNESHMYNNYFLVTCTGPFQKMLFQSKNKDEFLHKWYFIFIFK